jgi:pectin methylesterase-like acyl-CoA thioesterase
MRQARNHRRALYTAAVAALVSLSAIGNARAAATITVDDSGGADHTTIQAAMLAAAPGDTINVAPGSYVGPVVVN